MSLGSCNTHYGLAQLSLEATSALKTLVSTFTDSLQLEDVPSISLRPHVPPDSATIDRCYLLAGRLSFRSSKMGLNLTPTTKGSLDLHLRSSRDHTSYGRYGSRRQEQETLALLIALTKSQLRLTSWSKLNTTVFFHSFSLSSKYSICRRTCRSPLCLSLFQTGLRSVFANHSGRNETPRRPCRGHFCPPAKCFAWQAGRSISSSSSSSLNVIAHSPCLVSSSPA